MNDRHERPTTGARVGHGLGRVLAHGVWATKVLGAHHVPAHGPVLLAANHTGVVDGPVLVGASPRPAHMLIKQEMFAGPIGAVLRTVDQIAVDRDNPRAALAAALEVLKRGAVVGIFPEGSRGRGDASDSRAGITWLALNGRAPVVPVAILGTRRTGQGVNHLPRLRQRLVVAFGEPVVVERAVGVPGRQAMAEANDRLRDALALHVAATVTATGIPLPTDDPLNAV
ncbi:lysophospholipid acyltransferase family protein [Cellulomonas persica]|uniref:1-acyl-sn-glycerol-3-phosphate acyltransferase n=1 Tax=Cellulomonas persica TaxID=76861 RepID=A0A510UTR9_9CELL|nr:lysophospholipid acyltransferase family protein [Cellulomonas persica]GEK16861.1 1-acyl-sn-glycerol-3-phosphate acyltransferase [Cellulomonas persica]